MAGILLLNGPNLNMLGLRQPEVYGRDTLEDVVRLATTTARAFGLDLEARQSNLEGELVTWIQQARGAFDAIIINPGAYSHTSVAILDALNIFEGPVLEVHISNIHKRESFRHHSYVSLRAEGVIAGCGVQGYDLAVRRVAGILQN
ncbi:type II 3-dehydroquinate dehydratase [Falsigemmobacter faecalis]|uniref:3-dehydroquinate dehydratase n=1 Tax=Falsigemmobacter faecalis TaxID=2488730 RepID=A0A3P3DKM1_9RHOB|nr:type II 3-dehydroquinate dehydratase [Falsigemmobacter faecalis]RRH74809.1 type II 3-dehydroquinate dehydratase [Falsigemmobacter faecalis]